jgi:hypothetical protein
MSLNAATAILMNTITRLFGLITLTWAFVAADVWSVNAQVLFTNGTVAFYPLSGNANDASGHGNNGVISNVVFVADRFGDAASAGSFAGNSTSFITLNTTNLNLAPPFTVSVWVKFASGGTGRILSTSGYEIAMSLGRPGINVTDTANRGTNVQSVLPLANGQWHQIVGVWLPTGGIVYTNGAFAGAYSTTLQPVYSRGFIPKIARNSGSIYDSFGGQIDDLHLYYGALSAQQVAQLYQYESGLSITLLKAVKPSFAGLFLGTNYQLQVSGDLITWTNQGSPFTATSTSMIYPQYWDVDNWGQLFFRLQVSP